jgi:uncharacterized protein
MKVVLDTNVLVSAYASKKSAPFQILERLQKQEFELLISSEILAEYNSVLRYPKTRAYHKMNDLEIERQVERIKLQAIVVAVQNVPPVIIADPSDDKFLACALAGNADYIVSGDKHLLNLGIYQGIQILTPSDFLKILP